MKRIPAEDARIQVVSPPSRGRGLKRHQPQQSSHKMRVAPFTGARIETPRCPRCRRGGRSPPSRGRGLKLHHPPRHLSRAPSPPSRGRGLKHVIHPRNDASAKSPPSRGRGLKRLDRPIGLDLVLSPPSRGRGLKLSRPSKTHESEQVAPFTGARIETPAMMFWWLLVRVAPFTGARIETPERSPGFP